jgi:hypothetical protein
MHTEKIDVNDTSTEKVIHSPLALWSTLYIF